MLTEVTKTGSEVQSSKSEPQCAQESEVAAKNGGKWAPAVVLFLLLIAFVVLQCFLPLGTAVKIGADEDFEPSKVTLVQKGYQLYTEIWNDQPPLYTFLLRHLTNLSPTRVLGPRLLTVAFAVVLLSSFFWMIWKWERWQLLSSDGAVRSVRPTFVAAVATLLFICSPGFLELSCSVMPEIPALGRR